MITAKHELLYMPKEVSLVLCDDRSFAKRANVIVIGDLGQLA